MARSLVGTYARLAALPLEVAGYGLERLEQQVSPQFTRVTTVVRLAGGGEEGLGEDVVWTPAEHDAFAGREPVPLAGSWSLDGFSTRLGEIELFSPAPARHEHVDYRRWAFESAALDLALRQAGKSLADALARETRPVRFVVSMSLGEPPTIDPVRRWLALYPSLRFKLDSSSSWTEELVAELAATGAVDVIDLKGAYGEFYGERANPGLYALVARGFPNASLEDPDLTEDAAAVLADARERITWDAPIHSVADIEALAFRPRRVNIKPSRFGSLRALLEAYDWCEQHGLGMYGGGQFELGPGRGQIQYLASLFHPDAPNDVAPRAYNLGPAPGLPTSPLAPSPAATGFRWN